MSDSSQASSSSQEQVTSTQAIHRQIFQNIGAYFDTPEKDHREQVALEIKAIIDALTRSMVRINRIALAAQRETPPMNEGSLASLVNIRTQFLDAFACTTQFEEDQLRFRSTPPPAFPPPNLLYEIADTGRSQTEELIAFMGTPPPEIPVTSPEFKEETEKQVLSDTVFSPSAWLNGEVIDEDDEGDEDDEE